MKVTLAAASSIDGKITHGTDPDVRQWASAEDAEHFARFKASHNLFIMGRGTYEAMKPRLRLQADTLRIVLTSHPQDFAAEVVEGQLEFSNASPAELIKNLEKRGYSKLLLVGGGQLHAAFLAADLVDEIYLTIEPLIFGIGTDFAAGLQLTSKLQLVETTQLNERGSLLLHYRVAKEQS